MNAHYLQAGDTVDLKKFEPIEFAAYKEDLSGNEIYDEANENGRPEKKIFNGARDDIHEEPVFVYLAFRLVDS